MGMARATPTTSRNGDERDRAFRPTTDERDSKMADTHDRLARLYQAITELEGRLLAATDGEHAAVAVARVHDSVLRPLAPAGRSPSAAQDRSPAAPVSQTPSPDDADALDWRDQIWDLARAATELRVHIHGPALQEATAALQDLAISLADPNAAASRLTELENLQARLPAQIQAATNGPYLVTNADHLDNWLGEPLAARPQLALCRCGGSSIKPLCDGTHA